MTTSCYCFKIPILTGEIVFSPSCPLTQLSAMAVDFPHKHIFSHFKPSFQCALTTKSGHWISKIWFSYLLSSWTVFILMLPIPLLLCCTASVMHFIRNHSKYSEEPPVLRKYIAWLFILASTFVSINWTTESVRWLFLNWPLKPIDYTVSKHSSYIDILLKIFSKKQRHLCISTTPIVFL